MVDTPYLGAKPIETRYNGIVYRSRLEARWAIFFNSLSIPYIYEPEGFNLDGLMYLPDFWLPDQICFFEAKGPFTHNKGPEKAAALSIATGYPVFIFGSIPADEDHIADHPGDAYYPNGIDNGYLWCRSRCCGRYEIHYEGRADRIKCCKMQIGDRGHNYDDQLLQYAYVAARQCRFDGAA